MLNKKMFQRCLIHCRRFCSAVEEKPPCDVAVIGAGIIGTAIARNIKLTHQNLKVCLFEKECKIAKHQSSHNSGVMHCGVYYRPQSLKAKFCVEGLDLLQKYCDEKCVKYNKRGKLIVAKDCSEVDVLRELYERGQKNGVKDLKILENQCEIRNVSPGCRGVQALWCPTTANVDFIEVAKQMAKDFQESGGRIILNFNVRNILESDDCARPVLLVNDDETVVKTKFAVLCGGLQSAYLTKLVDPDSLKTQSFISLKVDYQKIESIYCDNVNTNIYPVPDLTLPFLGAHFSPQVDDTVLLGPYALPALKTEGYSNSEVNLEYLKGIVFSCGFRNMVINNFSKCINQTAKAICSEVQVKNLQELVPNFSYQFVKKGPTAVQCQLLNNNGTFVDDFKFDFFTGNGIGKRVINVKFTPSPAATSCLAIANYVTRELSEKLSDK